MKHKITYSIIIFGFFFSKLSYADYAYGLVKASKDGYYFHTDEQFIEAGDLLKLVSSGITINFVSPIQDRDRSQDEVQFLYQATYAYKVKGEKLAAVNLYSSPAIVLNSKTVRDFAATSLVSSACTSNEGVHHSVWKKGNTGFERVGLFTLI